MNFDVAAINGTLPKLINHGRDMKVAQSRFFKKMKKVKETNKINPAGVYQGFLTLDNNTAFGVGEGGPILGGGALEYAMGQAGLRAHWSSMSWTGKLERIASQYLTSFQRDPEYAGQSMEVLSRLAQNKAVEAQVYSTLKTFAVRDNFFALQGTETSPIGVVTDVPAANGGTAPASSCGFSWDTTMMGNRFFDKNQQVNFYNAGAVRDNGLAAGVDYVTVDQQVDKSPDSGDDGFVHFSAVPTDVAVGDTVHFRNSYGLMPLGFLHYVDDVDEFNGITRSDDPSIFSSVITRLVGSPNIGPTYIREQLSYMESKMGYGVPMDLSFWINKTQQFNLESQMYAAPFVRNLGAGKVERVDLAPAEMEWDGRVFNIDAAVPPADLNIINFLTWERIVQTPLMPYQFDSGSYVVNPINSSGERLDARQSTVFTEYNWVCWDARSNGRIEGFAFNRKHI